MPDTDHGGKHHKIPPAVNPAVYTALVVHDMALEGTVDQDAHIVAKEIEDTDHE
jgi:hypothetical protein